MWPRDARPEEALREPLEFRIRGARAPLPLISAILRSAHRGSREEQARN